MFCLDSKLRTNILYTLGFPIFNTGVDYTIFSYIIRKPSIIVVERPSILEVSLRLIVQSLTILPYQSRYSLPLLYHYNSLVVKALRSSPQFKRFNVDLFIKSTSPSCHIHFVWSVLPQLGQRQLNVPFVSIIWISPSYPHT